MQLLAFADRLPKFFRLQPQGMLGSLSGPKLVGPSCVRCDFVWISTLVDCFVFGEASRFPAGI